MGLLRMLNVVGVSSPGLRSERRLRCVWSGFEARLRCVWYESAQDAKRSYCPRSWFSMESRALRSERRLRRVWSEFEVRLRCVWHGLAQNAERR